MTWIVYFPRVVDHWAGLEKTSQAVQSAVELTLETVFRRSRWASAPEPAPADPAPEIVFGGGSLELLPARFVLSVLRLSSKLKSAKLCFDLPLGASSVVG